jgi:hypothetical protein
MLYIQQFHHNRQDYLRHHQHLRGLTNQNFSLSSNQYTEKFPNVSQPATPYYGYSRNQTLFLLSHIEMVG